MKTPLHLFFTIIFGAGIISCGKSKDTNPSSHPLYGSWQALGSTVTGCTDPQINHSTNNCCGPGELCCNQLVFTAATMTTKGITGTSSSAYSINGNAFHYPSDGGVPTTFSISGTTLTLSFQHTVADGNCLIVSTYTRM